MTQQSIHDRIMSRGQNSDVVQSGPADASSSGRNWWKTAALSLLGAVAVGAVGYCVLSYSGMGSVFSQPAVAETNEANPGLADTPFLQHVKQAGISSCSTMFPALGELLTNGTQYSVQSSWNTGKPNDHAVQAFVGMNYASNNYNGPAAGIVYAAPTGSACEGTMIRVAPFPTSCGNIPAVLPEGSKLANTLGQVALYSLGDNGGDALLLPNGNSCIVISVASATK